MARRGHQSEADRAASASMGMPPPPPRFDAKPVDLKTVGEPEGDCAMPPPPAKGGAAMPPPPPLFAAPPPRAPAPTPPPLLSAGAAADASSGAGEDAGGEEGSDTAAPLESVSAEQGSAPQGEGDRHHAGDAGVGADAGDVGGDENAALPAVAAGGDEEGAAAAAAAPAAAAGGYDEPEWGGLPATDFSLEVGPGLTPDRYCSPRHPTHFKPSLNPLFLT